MAQNSHTRAATLFEYAESDDGSEGSGCGARFLSL